MLIGKEVTEETTDSSCQQTNSTISMDTFGAVLVNGSNHCAGDTKYLPSKPMPDHYNEAESEQQFLQSKPTCFIIFGKPGSGKTTLAKQIAQEWRCEFINPHDLISQELELLSEDGTKCWNILCKGEDISEEVIFQLLEKKINSPEVAHHGYILDDYPTVCENYMNIKDQIEQMRTWKLTPDFIINLKIPDEDLSSRRIFQQFDSLTGIVYTDEVCNPEKVVKKNIVKTGVEEESNEETEENKETDELSPDVLDRLVQRPEDLPLAVGASIEKYKSNLLRLLENYMMDHDHQCIIEVDANQSIDILIKQLLNKFECFGLSPAAVLQCLHDEEDESTEDLETEEIFKIYSSKQIVAGQFAWKKSRWLRNCPVALYEGNVIVGKPEYAVRFLDKIYFLSSIETMERFLRNPRPYLLSTQPCPPCKISVLGMAKSGKTTLCYLLANKYKAKVIDMQKKMKEFVKKLKTEQLEKWHAEAVETAISIVKNKVKILTEKDVIMQKENAKLSEVILEEAEKELEKESSESHAAKDNDQKPTKKHDLTNNLNTVQETITKIVEEPTIATLKSELQLTEEDNEAVDDLLQHFSKEAINDKSLKERIETAIKPIDINSPEVHAIVERLLEDYGEPDISLSTEQQCKLMERAIKDIETKNLHEKDAQFKNGGWVLDDFPSTQEQWQICAENNWLPDNVIILKDLTENCDWLMQIWLQNHSNISLTDQPLNANIINIGDEKGESDEIEIESKENIYKEEKYKEAEPKSTENITQIIIDREMSDVVEDVEGEKAAAEIRHFKVADGGNKGAIVNNDDISERNGESDNLNISVEPTEFTEKDMNEEMESFQDIEVKAVVTTPRLDQLHHHIKVSAEYREELKKKTELLNNLMSTIASITTLEPNIIDISNLKIEDILNKAYQEIERPFQYQAVEYSLNEMEEDDENYEAEPEEEPEEEEALEEEEEDTSRGKKRLLGNLSYFCPVMLKEKGVLFPGKPEICAKYENKLYYMSSVEALEKFMNQPAEFTPSDAPFKLPKLRICIIGVHGSGKTVYGRYLARKLGIFHISFHDKLQELIMKKTGKKTGPFHEEEVEVESMVADISDEERKNKHSKNEFQRERQSLNEPEEISEDEETIKFYLEGDSSLSHELLERILSPWWFQEPYRSTGFILEGFPKNAEEVTFMLELGILPEAIIILNLEDSDVIARLLPPKMALWKAKRDEKLARIENKKQFNKKEREGKIMKRRVELLKELEDRRALKQAELNVKEGEENEDNGEPVREYNDYDEELDVETILFEEFQDDEEEEMDEEEEDESEEDAYDRFYSEISEMYENDSSKISTIQDSFEELLIPRIVVDSSRRQHIVNYVLMRSLKPYVEFRASMLERVYPVSEEMAKRLLQIGYKQPSSLGYWCPVKLKEGDCIQPLFGKGHAKVACIYRQHIYFLASNEARDAFSKNPLYYLENISPKPIVPIKLAIIGPPKSGKTYICNRLAEQYGIMKLSIGDALRNILNDQPTSHLCKQIFSYLKKGATVPDELAVQALEVTLLDVTSQNRGYVLDGFPVTKSQVELLTMRNIIPVRVIVLDIDSLEVVFRGTIDRVNSAKPYLMHDSGQILALKYQVYKKESKKVQEWYESQHDNLYVVNAKQSKWAVWNEVIDVATDSIKKIQNYLQNTKEGKAARLAGLCITREELFSRLGEFDEYCPVTLALHGEMAECSKNISMNLVAEFQGRYYKMEDIEKLKLFMEEPQKFVPPNAPRTLPSADMIPREHIIEGENLPYELKGYCPVTFLDGKCRYEAIIPGNPKIVVKYKQQFYCFVSKDKLDKFMRLPEQYCGLVLPHKLPPRLEPIQVNLLPNLGFMEQAISTPILKALVAVGNFKPKYPFLSTTRSAHVYVAYHLKAFNSQSSDYIRKKYRQKLKKFEEGCQLIGYLSNNMATDYQDTAGRASGLDNKIDIFFALKGLEPNPTWMV